MEYSNNEDILNQLYKNINKVDFEFLAFEDKKTESCKLTKNHYLVICIEQLLIIAKDNKWSLCKKNGEIFLFNGRYWNEIDKERFQFFLGRVALKMGVERFRGKIHTFKEDLFKQFMGEAYLPKPETKTDSVLINLLNGTYEISSIKRGLRNFDEKDFIRYQLPFKYDSNAKAPKFQKYLDEVLPDKDKQKVLAEFCGYIFIKPSVLKLEKVLLLFGSGANGKSVFFEVLNALLGSENVSNYSLEKLTHESNYRAKIANKLVNYASEVSGKLETDVFKQLASGEPIDARLLYNDPIIITEYAKLIFNCNTLPKEVEQSNAYFRRFLIIEFDVTFPEEKQDKQLSNKIIANELSGVFNWVLNGLDRLLEQSTFSKCDAIDNAKSNYEKQSDSVKLFLEEFDYKPSQNYVLLSFLFKQYQEYCINESIKLLSKSSFRERLTYHKINYRKINVGWVAYISISEN